MKQEQKSQKWLQLLDDALQENVKSIKAFLPFGQQAAQHYFFLAAKTTAVDISLERALIDKKSEISYPKCRAVIFKESSTFALKTQPAVALQKRAFKCAYKRSTTRKEYSFARSVKPE